MKKSILFLALAGFLITATVLTAGPELTLYGFAKGDMVYATNGVNSFTGTSLVAPQQATSDLNPALGFTAMHSRLGVKGTKGEGIKVGGCIELDFFGSGFDANVNPRIRLAYASLAKGKMEVRFGQQWDLYSPLNATTNNTNGNLWYAGNRGFRRAQIQFHYKVAQEGLAPLVQLSVGEGCKETSGLGADNKSGMPMVQGRVSANFMGKHTLGAYIAYAKYSPVPDSSDYDFNMSGFGVDFNMPFTPKLSLKGEVNMGTNLNNCNLFTIAGNGAKGDDRKSLGIWLNAVAKPSAKINLVGGFGMDKNQTDNLSAGTAEQNTVIYGDVIFPFEHDFSIAIEIQSISTKIKSGDTNSAIVFNVSGTVGF